MAAGAAGAVAGASLESAQAKGHDKLDLERPHTFSLPELGLQQQEGQEKIIKLAFDFSRKFQSLYEDPKKGRTPEEASQKLEHAILEYAQEFSLAYGAKGVVTDELEAYAIAFALELGTLPRQSPARDALFGVYIQVSVASVERSLRSYKQPQKSPLDAPDGIGEDT